ncbi:efflux RND transporter permease subunit [Rickettsiales endosymbiont of Peranema trichophorum]|uniref:efflux RND transporter permease subunit n=1 Tax=Rickettsiales endosymbiont of Peranema trichophorum TaxID=2486577 RepID=UPI001023065B|nr:efflux RND transporter permease subunit [Rickettsiales endosymbiont of Peranema trichophorum]RZI45428.1 efflux RND transporter permease subunit [Rickettsiales endosymbiont of Peranema trichophorum]
MISSALTGFVSRSRATLFCLLLILLYGCISYVTIPKESTPDVQIPMIYLSAVYPGISPEDCENLILEPLEKALRSINGIKTITSYAKEGVASIIMEFFVGFDSNKALQDVRMKIDDVRNELPKDMDQPTVQELNLSLQPVLGVILTGDVPERTLVHLAKNLSNKIKILPNVLDVKIRGDKEEQLEVTLPPKFMETYLLSINAISSMIATNNVPITAGSIATNSGEYSIKIPSLIKNFDELLEFPIKVSGDSVIKLKDVGDVKRTFKDSLSIARINGKPAVVLDVSKRIGRNIILTVAEIKEAVRRESADWPRDVQILYSMDESQDIKDTVSDLENNLFVAVILVLIVIVVTVGARSALIIALSIPSSFLAGVLMLYIAGYTLNMIVLFSLILTVGMIVDDAIVISEFADRKMVEGMSPSMAYLTAANRMLLPVFTSTLVKILVFLPLLFWPGIIGQFMKYMPITVIAILTNSLFFALFFQPVLGKMFGGKSSISDEEKQAMSAAENGHLENLTGISKAYCHLLMRILTKPKLFVLSTLGTLVAVYTFFFFFGTGKELFPKIEPANAQLIVQASGNLSLHQKDQIFKDLETRIAPFLNEIKIAYSAVGIEDTSIENCIGKINIEFQHWNKRRKASYIISDLAKATADIKGVNIQIVEERAGPPSGLQPISIDFSSRDLDANTSFVDQLLLHMKQIGGFKNINDSRALEALEWRVDINRGLAAKYGINLDALGKFIKLTSNGLKISSYRPSDASDELDIVLRFPKEIRHIKALENLRIVTDSGMIVPISQFAKIYPANKVGKIKRVDGERVITISTDVDSNTLVDTQVNKLKLWLDTHKNRSVNVKFKGEEDDKKESGTFLLNAFLVALLMMFMTMLVQFNSYYHTMVVMSAVFLSTVGVLLGLLISMQPFGIVMCGIGIIALSGVVLNNNILFIDTYQRLMLEGIPIEKAVVMAGVQRMRPILLTAITAILGLLPMVFGIVINVYELDISIGSPSSQWWRQLSASIAGGLAFATILTLFFTPALLLVGRRFDARRYIPTQSQE